MNLIPFERVVIQSPFDAQSIQAKLGELTEPWQMNTARKLKAFKNYTEPDPTKFEAKLNGNSFTLRRINGKLSNNGFRPIIKGRLIKAQHGTIARLTFRQQNVTVIGLLMWTTITLDVALLSIATSLKMFLTGFLFFLIGYSMFLVGYNTEIKYYKAFIRNVLATK
jgi:hypothetical protein